MGFFDALNDGISVSGRSSHRRHSSRSRHKKRRSDSRSRSRSSSRGRHRKASSRSAAGSVFGGDKHDKHNASRGSFFGLGGNLSRSSLFGSNRSSYYKRSPRQGFIQKSYRQLKRLLRDLVHWAKRHPWKVFFLVIMPLISGGVLTALLARFGLRIPAGIERMMGVASKAATGDSVGLVGEAVRMASNFGGSGGARVERSQEGGFDFERKMSYGGSDAAGWASNLMGGGGASGLMGMAKKWMD